MKNRYFITLGLSFLLGTSLLQAQSIADKKAALNSSSSDLDQETDQLLTEVNRETEEIQNRIKKLYEETEYLYLNHAHEADYKILLNQINENKSRLKELETSWREMAARGNRMEGYGLWNAPDTNLEQLIIDYGSQDYMYLIPADVGTIRLSIDSNLPIPRSSWNEMLELILSQNGVGIKTLNPYLRQLYLTKQNNSNLKLITNNRKDLEVLPSDARISFVLSPEPSEVRRVFLFLERFVNPNTTVVQTLGRDILLIGPVAEIQDLLKLYDFVANSRGDKDFRLVPVNKVKAEEMSRILSAIFDQSLDGRGTAGDGKTPQLPDSNGLRIITLENMAQALFIVGTKEEVRKAEEIVRTVESQVGGARDRVVFWYTVKHSDSEELADVLYRVYQLMIATGTGMETQKGPAPCGPDVTVVENQAPILPPPVQKEPPATLYGQEGFYQEGGYVVNPAPAQPGIITQANPNLDRENFIVDIKTGSIVMVVEADILPKLKELLRKLDVPKKMVQIETLLFEKILNRENSFGLNLLKIGDVASHTHISGAVFNNIFPNGKEFVPGNRGVFEYFLSRKETCSGIPAFDLAYRFLLTQDDVQINSSPSILTINQTPATIAINEDISINTGIFEVETAKGVTLKDAFTRAQYGITISIKPTIHMRDDYDPETDDDYDYVTLETDITFDTIHPGSGKDRPNVTRRHITNQVLVPDGDTVILGGLRRRTTNDGRESVPFIGEIPGLGKLFSMNSLKDSSTEMFIFITPHIVQDPKAQLTCLRQELLCRRPGDVPYFLECLEEAHRYEKERLFAGSMTILLGQTPARYYVPEGEYDGR
ncbi:MAG: type II secretion system protein GspD [Parachlamydiaceae bacterium]|nr:type II secretion system protein GspD [Parachlamydiaceae bacterium]